MLTENHVIGFVCTHLRACGYTIDRFAHTTQSGIDIEATRDDQHLAIEAKGETSSFASSSRHGRLFDTGQCLTSFSAALMKAISMQGTSKTSTAIALPSNKYYRKLAQSASDAMARLSISIYWVHADGSVDHWDPSAPGGAADGTKAA
jgi:hypothetical protein